MENLPPRRKIFISQNNQEHYLQREPTVTCESYTFQIRKLRPRTRGLDLGKMINWYNYVCQITCGTQTGFGSARLRHDPQQTNVIREKLVSFLERHEIANCDLYRGVLHFCFGRPMTQMGNVDVDTVVNDFFSLYRAALQECICLALLPPCPEPVEQIVCPLPRSQ